MIAVGIGQAPAYARVVRSATLSVREQVYIEAALATGTVGFASAIVIGSSLGFLGLGAQPPTPEWGAMVSEGRAYMRTQWWIPAFPGAMIGVAVLALNILGDSVRDILDPKLRGRR
jgi:peptide/nickel transport system permease protein